MFHIQHPTLFVLCIYFSLHLDTDHTLWNVISQRRSSSPLMFFQLPLCSCEPNYHSSQKIAALWKEKREFCFLFATIKFCYLVPVPVWKIQCVFASVIWISLFPWPILPYFGLFVLWYSCIYCLCNGHRRRGASVMLWTFLECIFLHLRCYMLLSYIIHFMSLYNGHIWFAHLSLISLWTGVGLLRLHRMVACIMWPVTYNMLFHIVSIARRRAFPTRDATAPLHCWE